MRWDKIKKDLEKIKIGILNEAVFVFSALVAKGSFAKLILRSKIGETTFDFIPPH